MRYHNCRNIDIRIDTLDFREFSRCPYVDDRDEAFYNDNLSYRIDCPYYCDTCTNDPDSTESRPPLIQAVIDNDVATVNSMLRNSSEYSAVNKKCAKGNTPLHYAVAKNRKKIFQRLLSLKNINVNERNNVGRTPLHLAISKFRSKYFVSKLIKRGADVNLEDNDKFTPLLVAILCRRYKIVKMLIENEVNLNTQSKLQPLRYAVRRGYEDIIYLLLFYMDYISVDLIDIKMVLALKLDDEGTLQDILLNYISDEFNGRCNLEILNCCFYYNPSLAKKIISNVSEITYDTVCELAVFREHFLMVSLEHLRPVLEKMNHIIPDIFPHLLSLEYFVDRCEKDFVEKLYWLSETRYWPSIVEFSRSSLVIYRVLKNSNRRRMDPEVVMKVCLHLCSYGVPVTFLCINTIYKDYGCSKLYRVLRQFIEGNIFSELDISCFLPAMQCRTDINLADILEKPLCYSTSMSKLEMSLKDLMRYFSGWRVRECCLRFGQEGFRVCEDIIRKAETIPVVPTLKELSRDASRDCIIKKYKIKNVRQLYNILGRLKLNGYFRNIIMLYLPLYKFEMQFKGISVYSL